MAQSNMFYLQFLVPFGYPKYNDELDKETTDLARSIKDVDKKFVKIPNSALFIKVIRMLDGATVEVKKRNELAFIYFCCLDFKYFDQTFFLVNKYYADLSLGTPAKPFQSSWIHCIPMPGPQLRENEIRLCQKLAVTYSWMLFYQEMKRNNPLN